MSTASNYISSVQKLFRYYKNLGEEALEQLSTSEVHFSANPESNSAAIIVKHLAGNMLSRWTDFLTSDGEKEWRNRDSEFIDEYSSREEMMAHWTSGWDCLFKVVDSLDDATLEQTIYIRNEGHTALEAINRQLAHYSYHIGQLVFVAKSIKGDSWKSLSIPKGESRTYNADKFKEPKSKRHFV